MVRAVSVAHSPTSNANDKKGAYHVYEKFKEERYVNTFQSAA